MQCLHPRLVGGVSAELTKCCSGFSSPPMFMPAYFIPDMQHFPIFFLSAADIPDILLPMLIAPKGVMYATMPHRADRLRASNYLLPPIPPMPLPGMVVSVPLLLGM